VSAHFGPHIIADSIAFDTASCGMSGGGRKD
jgi:hypothetical protein